MLVCINCISGNDLWILAEFNYFIGELELGCNIIYWFRYINEQSLTLSKWESTTKKTQERGLVIQLYTGVELDRWIIIKM